MITLRDEFLSEEDLDLRTMTEAELCAYWDMWLRQAQATNDLDRYTYSHGVFTSALTFAEASRALVRARMAGRITPAQERAALRALQTFERRCAVVPVTDAVLVRAGRPFPVEPIRTLDAAHLATAELLGERPQFVTIITRDARVAGNARALGYVLA